MEDSKKANKIWNKFVEQIMNQNRFFINEEITSDFVEIINRCKMDLNPGITLFRARINRADKENEDKPYKISDMGAPPANKVSDGRGNPKGIPYLYLSTSKKTAIYEVRPYLNDRVTVVKGNPKKKLKIVDLEIPSMLPEQSYLEYLHGNLKTSFSRAIKSSDDNKLSYLPNQYICELVKNKGFDGIKYKSCMNKEDDAYNILIFDEGNIEFKQLFSYKISSINYLCEPKKKEH